MPGYGRRATWSIWTIPPFFVDRVEDAVPPGPQAPQIGRPVRERLRRPRLIGELTDGIPSAATLGDRRGGRPPPGPGPEFPVD